MRLRTLSGPPGTPLAAWLDNERHFHGEYLRPLVASFRKIVAAVDLPAASTWTAGDDLPEGSATPEAVAVRLRRDGCSLTWHEPIAAGSVREVEAMCRSRGRSSVEVLRADPTLVTELQVGSWFQAAWTGRLVRRLLMRAPWVAALSRTVVRRPTVFRFAADVAFWAGVRSRATPAEWARLTRSSYVAFCYHRLAGELRPGEEQLDVPPEQLKRQLRALRLLGYRPLRVDELIAFHQGALPTLPRRRYVLTADDAYVDAVRTLQRTSSASPLLFVVTRLSGGGTARVSESLPANLDQAPIADWDMLRAAAQSGIALGSHSRSHPSLPQLNRKDLADELEGARADFALAGVPAVPVLAYPYGRHDETVRDAVIAAGYVLAYSTQVGRNGAGSDHWCLHRISVHARDGLAAFLWKAVTGEPPPKWWEKRQLRYEQRTLDRRRRAQDVAG